MTKLHLKKKTKAGFSLIEVSISLFVLTIGLVAVINLEALNYTNAADARDQVIAAVLAQDGLEIAFNIKDNNKLNIATTLSQFKFLPTSNTCIIDRMYAYNPAAAANNLDCASANYVLKYSDVEGYNHSVGANTKFSRRLTISGAGVGDRVVTAYVSWNAAPRNIASCNMKTKCVSAEVTMANN